MRKRVTFRKKQKLRAEPELERGSGVLRRC